MKLRIAVIGVGYFGRHYVRLLSKSDKAVLSAVAIKEGDDASKIKEMLPEGTRMTDAYSILNDPEIDAVMIATPVSTHFKFATDALRKGKHVFVEKPMCMSFREALKMREAVRSSGRTFMLGHQYMYNEYVQHMKEVIASGSMGKPKYVSAEQLYFTPIRHDIGCFWETATHELAILDYLFKSSTIAGSSGYALSYTDKKRDDFASAQIRYKNGMTAFITTSWYSPIRSRKIMIGMEKGMIVFDERSEKDKLKIYNAPYPLKKGQKISASLFQSLDAQSYDAPKYEGNEPLQNELNEFLTCIETNKIPITDIEHGIRIIENLEKIYKSFKK